jgi:hypothetical protein
MHFISKVSSRDNINYLISVVFHKNGVWGLGFGVWGLGFGV